MLSAKPGPMGAAAQRGMSLVELMVGIAVGMFIVAAAATLVSSQLVDNRRLMLELQVQQDLRATADIITRDIRRIGAYGATSINETGFYVWDSGTGSTVETLFSGFTLTGDKIEFWSPRQLGDIGPYGYMSVLSPSSGVIKSQLSSSGWQQLTDSDAMKVTAFSLTAADEPPVTVACTKACPGGGTACWPTVTVRKVVIDITGQAKTDASIVRRVRSVARLRNDQVNFNVDPANLSLSCPT